MHLKHLLWASLLQGPHFAHAENPTSWPCLPCPLIKARNGICLSQPPLLCTQGWAKLVMKRGKDSGVFVSLAAIFLHPWVNMAVQLGKDSGAFACFPAPSTHPLADCYRDRSSVPLAVSLWPPDQLSYHKLKTCTEICKEQHTSRRMVICICKGRMIEPTQLNLIIKKTTTLRKIYNSPEEILTVEQCA